MKILNDFGINKSRSSKNQTLLITIELILSLNLHATNICKSSKKVVKMGGIAL